MAGGECRRSGRDMGAGVVVAVKLEVGVFFVTKHILNLPAISDIRMLHGSLKVIEQDIKKTYNPL